MAHHQDRGETKHISLNGETAGRSQQESRCIFNSPILVPWSMMSRMRIAIWKVSTMDKSECGVSGLHSVLDNT